MAIDSISRQSWYLCAVLLVAITSKLVQSASYESTASSCASKQNCHECIQTKSCSWCLQPDYGDKPRCFQPSHDKSINNCAEEYTWDPDNEQRLVIAEELTRGGIAQSSGGGQSIAGGSYEASSSKGSSSSSGSTFESYSKQTQTSASQSSRKTSSRTSYGSVSSSGRIVQIYPQRVNLKLRISTYIQTIIRLLMEKLCQVQNIMFCVYDICRSRTSP